VLPISPCPFLRWSSSSYNATGRAAGQIVYDANRRAAIQEFLQNPQAQAQIKIFANKLNVCLTAAAKAKRSQYIGLYLERAEIIKRKTVDFRKTPECDNPAIIKDDKIVVVTDGSTRPLPDFIKCSQFVWSAYADDISELLKLVDSYDQIADGSSGADTLTIITNRLSDIANNRFSKEDDARLGTSRCRF
jgi:hypothetical protein